MQYYRSRGMLESALWAAQYALLSIGIAGVAWYVLKPEGWLWRLITLIADHRPTSLYYLAVAAAGLLSGTFWLNWARPGAVSILLTIACAFAGTCFVLRLLLPL